MSSVPGLIPISSAMLLAMTRATRTIHSTWTGDVS
jgi:hypothetical protein